MILRWVSAAVRDASERFRRVRGYREIELLVVAPQRFEADPEHTFDAQVA